MDKKLLNELETYLARTFIPAETPISLPRFDLRQKYSGQRQWFETILAENLPTCRDVTPDILWQGGTDRFRISGAGLKQDSQICFWGMLLLPDEEIDALCEKPVTLTPSPENPDMTVSLQLSRSTSFCCWDSLFSRLLLAGSPVYLPPFFESRKMVCVSIRTETGLQMECPPLDKQLPIFGGGVFQPGYLIPLVNMKENQKPVGTFVDHQYRYSFPEANPDLQFLVVTPVDAPPFILYPHDMQGRKYITSDKIESYTAIFRSSFHSGGDIPDTIHPDIVRHMKIIQDICQDIKPGASFYHHYLSAIPTRGDLRYLLTQHPLAKRMGLSIENFSHFRLDARSDTFARYHQMERLKNYAWFLNDGIEPAVGLADGCQHSFIVLSFNCQEELSSVFYENFLDYICSYLNQHVMGPCHIIHNLFDKRLRKDE